MASRESVKTGVLLFILCDLITWNAIIHNKFTQHEKRFQAGLAEEENTRPKRSTNRQAPPVGGATYIRWGRTECPDEADLVYKGFAAGGWYAHTGAGSEYICLTDNPKYAKHKAGVQNYLSFIYGVEFQVEPIVNELFEHTNSNPNDLPNSDVQCAVCRSRLRTSSVMIPGTNECISGWNMEYWGYLMSSSSGHKAQHTYACVDHAPQKGTEGGAKDEDGAQMHLVEGRCGSLPCQPYKDGHELSCVVCTK
ncbi:uncharacterized protein LOC135483706 [Lineus longissimus]|uniref:uncharacterized protein LOC135483706 n=1 Tax=Lineus longissimus TaxID=88925 RepID=UPI00315C86A6